MNYDQLARLRKQQRKTAVTAPKKALKKKALQISGWLRSAGSHKMPRFVIELYQNLKINFILIRLFVVDLVREGVPFQRFKICLAQMVFIRFWFGFGQMKCTSEVAPTCNYLSIKSVKPQFRGGEDRAEKK